MPAILALHPLRRALWIALGSYVLLVWQGEVIRVGVNDVWRGRWVSSGKDWQVYALYIYSMDCSFHTTNLSDRVN